MKFSGNHSPAIAAAKNVAAIPVIAALFALVAGLLLSGISKIDVRLATSLMYVGTTMACIFNTLDIAPKWLTLSRIVFSIVFGLGLFLLLKQV